MKHHPMDHIERFVAQVRDRLNQHHGVSVLVRSLAVGGVFMLGVASAYRIYGWHVPWPWYPGVMAMTLTVGAVAWWCTRHSQDQATHFADHHFNLKDSVRSYTGFHSRGRQAGFYALQAEQTQDRVTPLRVSDIGYQWPTKTAVLALVLWLACCVLGFFADSPDRVAGLQAQALTLTQSAEINETLKEALETLEQQLREEDLDRVVDVNTLKAWVNQLRETPDIKEAMRQYTQFEKNLKGLSLPLQQRKDQQLLDRIGQQLQKDDASKALGKQLSQRDYKKASESLSKFKINPAAQFKAQQTQTEQLKAMAGRMAQEVSRTQTAQSQASKGDASTQQDQSSTQDPLSEKVEQLNKSAQQMSEAQKQANSQTDPSQNAQACEQCAAGANRDLDALSQHMQRMAARQQAQSRIDQLLQSLSQAQNGLGQGSGQGQGGGKEQSDRAGQGGKEAGTGSDSTTNTSPVENTDQGFLDRVNGTPGTGPSATALEEASDGSGAGTGADTRDREIYQQQMESFIRREDVPEAVKSGVKAYFENIHQTKEGN